MIDVVLSVGVVPLIKAAVDYLKPTFDGFSDRARPIAVIVSAIVLGELIAFAWSAMTGFSDSVIVTAGLGVLSGFLASVYHDVTKPAA
jgi:hypothetical protein